MAIEDGRENTSATRSPLAEAVGRFATFLTEHGDLPPETRSTIVDALTQAALGDPDLFRQHANSMRYALPGARVHYRSSRYSIAYGILQDERVHEWDQPQLEAVTDHLLEIHVATSVYPEKAKKRVSRLRLIAQGLTEREIAKKFNVQGSNASINRQATIEQVIEVLPEAHRQAILAHDWSSPEPLSLPKLPPHRLEGAQKEQRGRRFLGEIFDPAILQTLSNQAIQAIADYVVEVGKQIYQAKDAVFPDSLDEQIRRYVAGDPDHEIIKSYPDNDMSTLSRRRRRLARKVKAALNDRQLQTVLEHPWESKETLALPDSIALDSIALPRSYPKRRPARRKSDTPLPIPPSSAQEKVSPVRSDRLTPRPDHFAWVERTQTLTTFAEAQRSVPPVFKAATLVGNRLLAFRPYISGLTIQQAGILEHHLTGEGAADYTPDELVAAAGLLRAGVARAEERPLVFTKSGNELSPPQLNLLRLLLGGKDQPPVSRKELEKDYEHLAVGQTLPVPEKIDQELSSAFLAIRDRLRFR